MQKKVLIIEDNEQNLYLTTFLLEKQNYEVIQAQDGQKGMQLAATKEPDLILLDIQLPLMNGYEVARQLKQNKETKEIPIVAVTSYAMVGDQENILAAGCEGYVEKPIDPETFIDQIQSFLP